MLVNAGFVSIDGRNIFRLHHRASSSIPRYLTVLIPPLFEEMNRCRRVSALIAAQLRAAECDCLQMDLFGTGDSGGDTADAGWSSWADEIVELIENTHAERSAPIVLVPFRSGALLLDLVRQKLTLPVERVVAVQPVLDGNQFLQQLLRLRVMAAKFAGTNETASELREIWRAGGSVEIAGYEIGADLAGAIENSRLSPAALNGLRNADFLEFRDDAAAKPTTAGERFCERAGAAGNNVNLKTIAAPQFWASQQTLAPPEVVSAVTAACIGEHS